MGVFDIKQIRPVVPTALYDKLRGEVRVGDYKAVSETNDGQSYLLAGLLGDELDRVLSSDDEIGQLTHALNNVNMMSHATMNGDIRQRQLILVLDEATRAFLETKVPSLVQPDVNWTIFEVKKNIDDDDNALAHASIVYQDDNDDKSGMVQVTYEGIADYLNTHGHVQSIKNDALGIDPTPENPEKVAERDRQANDRHSIDTGVKTDDSLDNSDRDSESVQLDPNDKDMTEQVFGDEPDPFGEDSDDGESGEIPSADDGLPDDEGDVDDTIHNFDPNDYSDLADDNSASSDADLHELEDIAGTDPVEPSSDVSEPAAVLDDDESLNFNTKTPTYTNIPDQLQAVLDSIKCPRLKLYTDTGVHTKAIAKINQRIVDFNNYLDAKEKQIESKVINAYQAEMQKALAVTNDRLNPETGDETVTDKFKRDVTSRDTELDEDAVSRVESKRQELESEFMGESFEQFKKDLLAQAEQLYRDKYYISRVDQPLKEFKATVEDDIKAKKATNRTDFYTWIGGLQTQAKESDMLNAIMHSRKLVENEREKLLALSDDRQKELTTHDKELISLEYDERARAAYNESHKRFDVDRAETDRLAQQVKDQKAEIRRLREMYQQKSDEADSAKWESTTVRNQLQSAQRRNSSLENLVNNQAPVSAQSLGQAPVPASDTTSNSQLDAVPAPAKSNKHHFFKQSAVTNSKESSSVTRQATPDVPHDKTKKSLKSKTLMVAACALVGLGGGVAVKGLGSSNNNSNSTSATKNSRSADNVASKHASSIVVESSSSASSRPSAKSASSSSAPLNGIKAPKDGKYQEGQVLSGTVNGKKENLTVYKINGNKIYLRDSQNNQFSFNKQ